MKETLLSIFIICGFNLFGQVRESGIISYEKRINVYSYFKNQPDSHNQQIADQYGPESGKQYVKGDYVLTFNKDESLYKPSHIEQLTDNNLQTFTLIGMNNTVHTDFGKDSSVVGHDLFGQKFWVQDKSLSIVWKVTNEKRKINGFECRRANGLLWDSIYVVAFYTSQIPVKGGPESFHGLPGMILFVTLPHYFMTWTAKNIEVEDVKEDLKAPSNKKIDSKRYVSQVEELCKKYSIDNSWAKFVMLF